MELSVAGKIAGGLVLAVGVPVTTAAVLDHSSLYREEKEAIDSGDLVVTVSNDSTESSGIDDVLLVTVSLSEKWSCEIKAKFSGAPALEITDKEKIKTYLEKEIKGGTEKQVNRKKLVESCSKKRISTTKPIKTEWVVDLEKENSKLMVKFFGSEKQEITNSDS